MEENRQQAESARQKIIDTFQKELQNAVDYFKKRISEINDTNELQFKTSMKNNARTRSDLQREIDEVRKVVDRNCADILKQDGYFDVMAEVNALVIENLNMQMESEYADLIDRKLMSLYGG